MALLERNAAAIARYVEHVRPRIPRSSHAPDTPMSRKERGKSASPLSTKGEWLVHHNREAATLIEGLLADLMRPGKVLFGVETRWMLREMEQDPAAARNWRKAATPEDARRARAFWQMCVWAARVLQIDMPCYELSVVVHPEEVEVLEAESPVHARNIENNARRKWEAQDRYRKLAAELREIMTREGCGPQAAIGLHRDRLQKRREEASNPAEIVRYCDVSPATCYRALGYQRAEEERAS